MKKTLITIMMGLFLISLASAMYSGENETFDMGFEIVNCSIINNTYNLEGLNLTWNNTNATISTDINYKPDNFTISCWVIKYGEVVEEKKQSSSSSSYASSRVIPSSEIYQGYEHIMLKNGKIFFILDGTNHFLQLKNIGPNSAEFLLRSNEYNFNLTNGECKVIDEYGLNICVSDINSTTSRATVKIQAGNAPKNVVNDTEEIKEDNETVKDPLEPEEKSDNKSLIILLIIAVILGAVVLIYWNIKKKSIIRDGSIVQ